MGVLIGERTTSSGHKANVYKLCEMLGVRDYNRPYQLTDGRTTVTHGLLLAHGHATRIWRITATSNSAFTEGEFAEWKKQMRRDGLALPSKDALSSAYLNAIRAHKNFTYSAREVAKMRLAKQKHRDVRQLANPHKE